MAVYELPFIDSCQHYSTSQANYKWTTGTTHGILPTGGRDGNGAMLSGGLMKTFINEYATLTIGSAFKISSFAQTLFQVRNYRFGAPNIADVVIESDGRMTISSQFGNSTQYVPGFVANVNVWYFYEVKFAITTVSSYPVLTCEVHIDNAVIATGITFTGTQLVGTNGIPSTGAKIASVLVNLYGGADQVSCDLYVSDGEFFGDTSCRAYFPRADGTYTDGVPSTPGAHYPMVNEHAPDDGATTITLENVGDRDSYFMDTVSVFTQIFAAQFLWCAVKTDAGLSSFKGTLTSGASDIAIDDEAFPNFNVYFYTKIASFRQSPHTSIDWTVAELNGQEVGEERIT